MVKGSRHSAESRARVSSSLRLAYAAGRIVPPSQKPGVGEKISRTRLARGYVSPNTLPATISPTLADLSWAAGFLEGEGSFYRYGRRQRLSGACVYVHQTESPEPLQRLLRVFGGRIARARHKKKTGGFYRDGEQWYVYGARARGVMMTMYSLLSPKRQHQIRTALWKE